MVLEIMDKKLWEMCLDRTGGDPDVAMVLYKDRYYAEPGEFVVQEDGWMEYVGPVDESDCDPNLDAHWVDTMDEYEPGDEYDLD